MKRFIFLLLLNSQLFPQELPEEIRRQITDSPEILQNVDITNELTDVERGFSESGKDKSIDFEPVYSRTESKVFGFDYIKQIPRSISSTSDLPIPNDYIISLGDSLKIILTGRRNEVLNLAVGMNGSIGFPGIGEINVFGESISDVRKKIEGLIEISYVGTEVSISLDKLSAKKISIIGAIKNPGSYLVNPFTTITSALSYAGGFEEYSSLRNIILIRNGERIYFDLYEFLIYGDRSSDVNIEQGDTILIQSTNNHVEIVGEVIRPKIYEYLPSDTYVDLIEFAMGFTALSNPTQVNVIEDNNGKLVAKNIKLEEKVSANNIRSLTVGKKKITNNLGIMVKGNGVEEVFFEFGEFTELDDVISILNFSDDIYPFYAKLRQDSNNGFNKEVLSFSLFDKSSYQNFKLKENIEIEFFSREDIDEKQDEFFKSLRIRLDDEITRGGEEIIAYSSDEEEGSPAFKQNNQNEIENYESPFRVADLKALSFGENTFLAPIVGKVQPRSLFLFFGKDQVLDDSLVTASTSNGFFEKAMDKTLDAKELSQINFPELRSTKFFLEITGQVNNPGIFLASTDMTLQDAYNLAGGLTERADNNGIIFLRQSIKERQAAALDSAKKSILDSVITQLSNPINNVSTDLGDLLPLIDLVDNLEYLGRLSGSLSPESETAKNINLEPGDQLIVPAKSSSVTILGEVLQPLSASYERNLSIKNYIDIAGNLSAYADKNNIYIIRPDGTSLPIRYNQISKYKLQPGDTIIVPRNLEKLNTLPLISTSVKIISDIAFAAASLNILRN